MAGEIGRFTAIIGGDGSGLTRTLAGSATRIEGFVKDTQRSFAQIGVGGDFGRAGAKAGKEIVDALKAQLDAGRPLLRQFAENVDVGNVSAVRVVKQLVAEHQQLAVAVGASSDELRDIAAISHTLKGRELEEAARRARALEEGARGAQQQLRGISAAIRDAGRGAGGLDAISRRISQFSEGTGFASTRVQSLERLRAMEIALQRAIQSGSATLTQRIALERELARTSAAIQGSANGFLGAILGTSKGVTGLNAGLALMGRLFPALGAAAAAHALLGFASRTIDAADAMKDFAERSGASVEALSVLGQVAEKSGASNETLSVGLRNLAKNVEALRRGSKDASSAFASIGLTAEDFVGLSIDQVFAKVADAQARFADGSGKTALAMQLFGRSGEELIPTLNALANGGFDKATARARALGGVMSRDMVNAADQFNEAMTDLRTATGGLGRGILTDVLPPLTSFLNSLIDLRRRAIEAREAIPAPFRAVTSEFAKFAVRGPLFATVFGSETEEATRARSFGDRMKEAVQRLLGLKTAADVAQASLKGLSADPHLAAALATEKPDIATPTSRDDEIKQLRDLHNAFALNAADLARARELEKLLTKEIASGTLTREQRAKAHADLQALREVQTPKTDTKPVEELLGRVRALVTAYGLAADESGRQQAIIPKLIAGYDRVGVLLKTQANQESAISNELRQQLNVLKQMDPVIVGLARRQFGAPENLPTLTIPATADIVDIRVPTNVKQLAARTLQKITALPPVPVEIDPTFDPSNISLEFKNALSAARLAKADLDLSDAIGDQKAYAKASDASAAAQKRLKEVAAELAQVIRNNPALSEAAKAFGIEALNAQVQGAISNTSTLADNLRTLITAGRGILSTANAVGLIGDKAAKSLGATLDLVDASLQLVALTSKGGNVAGKVGAAIGAVGGIIGVIDALLSNPEGKANKQIIRGNTEALERMSQDLRAFAQSPGQLLSAARAINDNALLSARRATDGFTRGFKNIEELDRQLRASGTSIAELKRRAEELGITIVDAKGRITAQGLDALNKAMLLAAEKLVRFGNSFADQSDAAALRRRVQGQQDDQDRILSDSFALFRQFAPALYDKFFKGVDTTTAAGREEFKRAIAKFVDAFIAGIIPLADFGEFDKSTLTQIVTDWLDSMDAMTEATNKAVGSIVNLAQGFAVAKRVFDVVRNRDTTTSSGSVAAIIARPVTPTPIPTTTTGSTAGSVSISVDIGGVTVSPNVPATGAARYNEIRRQALEKAATISPDATAAVQKALPPL